MLQTIQDLDDALLTEIFSRSSIQATVAVLPLVCKRFRRLLDGPGPIWRLIEIPDGFPSNRVTSCKSSMMAYHSFLCSRRPVEVLCTPVFGAYETQSWAECSAELLVYINDYCR